MTATGTALSGEKISKTSTFRTLTPAQTFTTHIFEGYKETYGVGIPVMLTFAGRLPTRRRSSGRSS